MKQITVSVPDNLDKALRDIAEKEGLTISQLGLLLIQLGFPSYLEGLNKYQLYKDATLPYSEHEKY